MQENPLTNSNVLYDKSLQEKNIESNYLNPMLFMTNPMANITVKGKKLSPKIMKKSRMSTVTTPVNIVLKILLRSFKQEKERIWEENKDLK